MVPESIWLQVERGELAAALPGLLALENQGAMDAPYNALLAESALAAADYAQATLALERLVLLQPENAGAWLDLAVASFKMGDLRNAQGALERVEQKFSPPPGIQALLISLRRQMQVSNNAAPPLYRFRGNILFGRDSNANGGLTARNLTLTPGTGIIDLPVDSSFRAKSTSVWMLTAELATRQTLAGQHVEGRLALAENRHSGLAQFDTRDLAISGGWQHPFLKGIGNILLEWRSLEMGNKPLIAVPRLRLGLEWPVAGTPCRLGTALDAEWRHYQNELARYNGSLLWGEAGIRCTTPSGGVTALARVGGDNGSVERPGGDTRRRELTLAWQGALMQKGEAVLVGQVSRAKDDSGYSPLILHDARREIRRLGLKTELSWPIAEAWRIVASLEHIRQTSNLGLFGLEQSRLMTGFRYQQ